MRRALALCFVNAMAAVRATVGRSPLLLRRCAAWHSLYPRPMTRGIAIGLLSVVAACSGGNGPKVSRAEYCGRVDAELCSFFRRCGMAAPDASCAALLAPSNSTLFGGVCELVGPPFDVDAADACLDEMRNWGCGDGARSLCDPAARTIGAPCSVNCALGLKCVGPCGQKKCEAACKSLDPAQCVPSGVGGACTKGCKPGLRCVNGLCQEAPRIDEIACLFPSDCPWAGECRYSNGERRCWLGTRDPECGGCLRGQVCLSGPGCVRIGDIDETCQPSPTGSQCIPGAECVAGRCAKQSDEGGACPCLPSISCIDGRCVRERRPEGAECYVFAQGQCDTGLDCLPGGDAGAGACTRATYTPPPRPMTCP